MRGQVKSALVAGLLAAVIWMVIATAVDLGKGAVIGWGLGFLVIGALGTFAISAAIRRSRGGSSTARLTQTGSAIPAVIWASRVCTTGPKPWTTCSRAAVAVGPRPVAGEQHGGQVGVGVQRRERRSCTPST